MIGIAKKKCKNKRVYALRDGWTQIGIKKACKNKTPDALRGGWHNDWN